MTATGMLLRFIPEGPERDELLGLVRIGVVFRNQQHGRRPGFLTRYVRRVVGTINRPTFAALLIELELEALRRDLRGEDASPIERVNREWEMVTYHDPKRGRQQVSFKHIRNIATLRTKKHYPE